MRKKLWLSWSWDCMEYLLVSMRLSLVRYGFVEVLGCFHGPSCIVLKMFRYLFVYPGEGVGGSGSPWKSQKYNIPLQCWSSDESQSCQLSIQCSAIIGLPANSMAFRWWPDVVTLTVSPIKKVKVGPLCQNIMPPQVLRLNTPSPQSVLATPMWFSSWCNQSRLNSI